MTLSADNGTPAQPQPPPFWHFGDQAMGAARREPRRGEIPGARRQPRFSSYAHGSGSSVEWSHKEENEIQAEAALNESLYGS